MTCSMANFSRKQMCFAFFLFQSGALVFTCFFWSGETIAADQNKLSSNLTTFSNLRTLLQTKIERMRSKGVYDKRDKSAEYQVVPGYADFKRVEISSSSFNFTSAKKILFYTPFFGGDDFGFGLGNEPFQRYECPVRNCFTTADRSLLADVSDFDAIVFHPREMSAAEKPDVPDQSRRKKHQRYVMLLIESPANFADETLFKSFRNFFNWTMTYRHDSDVLYSYGWFDRKEEPYRYSPFPAERKNWIDFKKAFVKSDDELNMLAERPKLIAWIASNCNSQSRRERYVRALQKHVPVDVMGGCGKIQCPIIDGGGEGNLTKWNDGCSSAVRSDYKFYLSFENSLCKDYITEKFFLRMGQDVVPVVLGGGDYSEVAPPHSYIDTRDFASPEELAKYLLKLDGDPEEYLSYFWWKDLYAARWDRYYSGMCRLCEMLNKELPEKTYVDMEEWWVGGGKCEKTV